VYRRSKVTKADPVLLACWVGLWSGRQRALAGALAHRMGVDPELDFYPALVVSAAVGAIQVAVMHWCDQARATYLPDLANEVFDVLAAGLPEPHLTLAADAAGS
jgi:hypothetical protein